MIFFMKHFSLTVDYDHVTQLVNDIIDIYYNDPTMSENTLLYKEILLRQYQQSSFVHLADIYITCGKLPDRLQSVFNEMILELM